MKRANPSFGSPPPSIDPATRRPGESHTRLGTRQLDARGRAEPPAAVSPRRPKPAAEAEEPRTGVVRRVEIPGTALRGAADTRRAPRRADARHPDARVHHDDARSRQHADRSRQGEVRHDDVRARQPSSAPHRPDAPQRDHLQQGGARDDARAWRCLEWGQPPKERRPRRDPKVSVAQLSASGDLLRQHGPDAALPEAADFIHKMSALIAQGFGYVRCHSVCLKAPASALSVSEVGDTKVMAVSGPVRSMNHVLRRAGLS